MTRSRKRRPYSAGDLAKLRASFGVVRPPKFSASVAGMLAMAGDAGGCKIWLGAHDKDGRGIVPVRSKDAGGKIFRAHANMPWREQQQVSARRAMWFFSRGYLPPGQFVVMTICGERGCINPEHLALTVPGWQDVMMAEAAA